MKKLLLGLSLLILAQPTTSLEAPSNSMTNTDEKDTEHLNGIPKPNIGISIENQIQVGKLLNNLLANEFALYVKTLNYHWNVESHQFHSLHEFFKDLYEKQFDICDDVAERIRSLGEVASGTMQEFTKNSKIMEHPRKKLSDQEMIKQLLEDIEAIIRIIRTDAQISLDKYKDLGTNNFLLNLLEKQEKTAWMLRASLAK